MMNNQDIARLFVLLFESKYTTANEVRKNAQYLLQFFPNCSEEELCSESQKLIKQLMDIELQRKYGDVFRSLSIEQRYSICIEIPAHFHYSNNILSKWHEVYKAGKDKWFTAEEAIRVKEKIKEGIDRIRNEAQYQLRRENPMWVQWESAKEMLFVESSWDVENHGANVLHEYTKHTAHNHYVFLKTPDDQHIHYVTVEDALYWGKHNSIIWAEAVINGHYLRYFDGTVAQTSSLSRIDADLMPATLKDLPESQWDEQVYKHNQELEKWVQQMLGMCPTENEVPSNNNVPSLGTHTPAISDGMLHASNGNTHPGNILKRDTPVEAIIEPIQPNSDNIVEPPPIPVVTQPQCKVEIQPASSPKIPTEIRIPTIQRALKAEWQAFSESISDVYTASSIISQGGNVYPITCNMCNRKVTAKKNLKTITAHIRKIEALLSECKESFINISSIDTAFETLCSISHEIQTLTICLKSLENKYGYKYKVSSDTAKIMSSCIRQYVTLLSDSARKTLRSKDELISANKKLVQKIESITKKIETYRSDVAAARKKLERREQAWKAAQKSSQTHTDVLKAEADNLETTLSNLATSITRSEKSRTANETSLTAAKKQRDELQARQHTLQREYDQFVEANELTSLELQRQIQEAEAVLQKTLFFKKNKQQRVDELRAALTRHQETVRARKDCLEKEISSLRDSCSALNVRITQLATITSKTEATLSQLLKDKARIHYQLEDKKSALIMLEHDLITAQNAADTCREELGKQEGLLAASIEEQTNCSDELTKNQSELASFDESLLQKVIIYPKKYGKATPHVSAVATSGFAFTRQLTAEFAMASKSFADISKLTYQHMHLSALKQAFQSLHKEGLISEGTVLAPISVELDRIKEKLRHLEDEAKRCCAPFVPIDASAIEESKNTTFIKKANMLFEALWSQIADGTVLPTTLIYQLNAANCLQVSEGYYLCFTPFYVMALDLKKSKHVAMELLRYTDITFEFEELQVSLDYEKECPTDATVIAKHWKHETIAGAPNRRYTNNPSYLVVALNAVKLVCAEKTKTSFLLSFEEAQRAIQAFCDLRDFLHEENAVLMNRVFAENQIPNIEKIASEIAKEREKAENERKKQERRMKQQELALKQQREEEKRQEEQHQKHLEQWADSAQKSKAEDDLLVAERMDLLPPISSDQIANWDDQLCQPVTVTDRRRVITNGITKIEFVHQDEVKGISKYLAFFADANGKVFSDIRTLPSAPLGTKKVIPFEIKTQSESNPPKLYMLIRSIEDGQLVGKIEYKLNIAFTNDFDF